MTDEQQIEIFKHGFPRLDVLDAATPGHGIEILDETSIREAVNYLAAAETAGRCKFVPASGAASRMFKDIFALKSDAVGALAQNLEKFAFYDESVFGKAPYDPETSAHKLLGDDGLGYGSKPKGVLKFHRYQDGETRTAFAEHLIEGQEYMRNEDGSVKIIFTISPEHRELFEQALNDVRDNFEKRFGVKYDIRFTCQDKSTDTLAVTPDNRPFIKDDGTVLRRPAGHGALIFNLNEVEDEMVSIKNIDNVAVQSFLPVTSLYKKVLMGRALQLRDRVFGYLYALDQIDSCKPCSINIGIPGYDTLTTDTFATPQAQELCNEIEQFLKEELCIELPLARSCHERAEALRKKLNRPIRVCGMVRNQGEPGGGPFIVKGKDGSTSLQILEGVQLDRNDAGDLAALEHATHFNPVDLICCLKDYRGNKFNLLDHIDHDAGFISSKSFQGRELKALELPGLWNGAMSDWNTLFIEVPVETFNPVKQVLDLLRSAHQ